METNSDFIFLGIVLAASSQKKFKITPYTFGLQYLYIFPQTPKWFLDILTALLSNLFKGYWHVCIKRNMY
jgi:hypothetical protein